MDSSDDALPGHDLNHSNDTMTPFGYIPHFGINVTFVVAYSLLCAASLIQFLHCCWHKRHRRWLPRSFFMMAGIAVEMAGFVERVRIAKNSKGYRDFVLQVSLLNLAPAFVTAAIVFSIYECMRITNYSRRWRYRWALLLGFALFISASGLCVVIGTVATLDHTPELSYSGPISQDALATIYQHTYPFLHIIMVAMGITVIVTLSSMGCLTALFRYRKELGVPIPFDFAPTMWIACALILTRSIAKLLEHGVSPNEWVLFGLDSLLMVVANSIMIASHPILIWPVQSLPLGRVVDQGTLVLTAHSEGDTERQQCTMSGGRRDVVETNESSPTRSAVTFDNQKSGTTPGQISP